MEIQKKIKILHILWTGHSGGMEKFVYDVTRFADKERFEHQVCFLSSGGWIAEKIKKTAAETRFCLMKSGLSWFRGMKLIKVINELKPDIIMNHQRNFISNCYLSFFFNNINKIYYEHGGSLLSQDARFTRVFYKLFSGQYKLILTNSKLLKNEIASINFPGTDKVKVLYLGIDCDRYRHKEKTDSLFPELGLDPEKKIVGCVGRLVEQKGMDDFILAAKEIQKLEKECQFVIIGDGVLRKKLEETARMENVNVIFAGNREDVSQILQLFDLFLVTSKWEPFGLTVLEALASAVPVAGYYLEGMGEIFEHGGGGILMKERNARELAVKIVEILNKRDLYEKLSREGIGNVRENFEIRNKMKELEKHYLEVMN